jgi:hypothetical protein
MDNHYLLVLIAAARTAGKWPDWPSWLSCLDVDQ